MREKEIINYLQKEEAEEDEKREGELGREEGKGRDISKEAQKGKSEYQKLRYTREKRKKPESILEVANILEELQLT